METRRLVKTGYVGHDTSHEEIEEEKRKYLSELTNRTREQAKTKNVFARKLKWYFEAELKSMYLHYYIVYKD